jgi:hypothetical protein
MRVRVAIALSVIAMVLPIIGTSQLPPRMATPQETPTSTHGTINLLLANRNGTLLITDSRISNGDYQPKSDHAQKLFQLDDKTVCSIASFYSDTGPVLFQPATPDGRFVLFQSIDGMIQSFKRGLRPNLSVLQKADALAQYIGYSLALLENAKRASSSHSGPTYPQELVVVGYDADGSQMAVKRVISVRGDDTNNPRNGPVHYNIEQTETHRIDNQFFYIVAGVKDFAKPRLDHPDAESYSTESELTLYRVAHLRNEQSSLTLEQMKALAYYLESKSEKGVAAWLKPVIGGGIQEAILLDGKVTLFPPKTPFDPYPDSPPTNVFINASTSGAFLLFGSHRYMNVLINSSCNAPGGVILDNAVILGGVYDHCYLYFDGRAFYLDPENVSVRSATLVIGPHSNDQAVDLAVASLPLNISILCWKDLPAIPQNIQRAFIWNLGLTPDTISAPWNTQVANGRVWTPVPRPPGQAWAIKVAENRCTN